MNAKQLTKTQRRWKKHVIAALQSGLTLQTYADQQGLKIKALYDWKHRLIKMGTLDDAAPLPALFQKVQLASSDYSICTINLPNSIKVEWPAGATPEVLGGAYSQRSKNEHDAAQHVGAEVRRSTRSRR